jgi:hypothetical protein
MVQLFLVRKSVIMATTVNNIQPVAVPAKKLFRSFLPEGMKPSAMSDCPWLRRKSQLRSREMVKKKIKSFKNGNIPARNIANHRTRKYNSTFSHTGDFEKKVFI